MEPNVDEMYASHIRGWTVEVIRMSRARPLPASMDEPVGHPDATRVVGCPTARESAHSECRNHRGGLRTSGLAEETVPGTGASYVACSSRA
jgi:hypothetical protein